MTNEISNSNVTKFDLEDRLIDFVLMVNKTLELLPKTYLGNNLSSQLTRSSTSPALNYGEARSAESKKDFVHKVKIVLKELRETRISLKIINKANLYKGDVNLLRKAANECEELISIFVSSSKTVQKSIPKYR